MNMGEVNKWLLFAALGVAFLFGNGALGVWDALGQKTARQQAETAALVRWQTQRYELAPVADTWRSTFASVGAVRDIAGFYRSLGIRRLTVDPDTLAVQGVQDEAPPLEVSRFCVQTAGEAGLLAYAGSMGDALTAVEELAARPDVRIGRVQLDMHQGRPRVVLGTFCVVLRRGNDDAG